MSRPLEVGDWVRVRKDLRTDDCSINECDWNAADWNVYRVTQVDEDQEWAQLRDAPTCEKLGESWYWPIEALECVPGRLEQEKKEKDRSSKELGRKITAADLGKVAVLRNGTKALIISVIDEAEPDNDCAVRAGEVFVSIEGAYDVGGPPNSEDVVAILEPVAPSPPKKLTVDDLKEGDIFLDNDGDLVVYIPDLYDGNEREVFQADEDWTEGVSRILGNVRDLLDKAG